VKLAELFVEFVVKGADGLKAAMGGLKGDASTLAGQFAATGDAGAKGLNAAAKSATILGAQFAAVKMSGLKSDASALAAQFAAVGAAGTKGFDAAKQASSGLAAQLAAIKGFKLDFGDMAGKIAAVGDKSKSLGGVMEEVSNKAVWGFAAATASIGGFIREGIGASNMGQVLGFQFQQLSRQIASLFLPEIKQVVNWLQQTVQWFRGLSGEQQANIKHWIEAGVAALGVVAVFPKVIAGMQFLGVAWKALSASFAVGLSATGIGALLPLLGLVAAGITAVLVGTDQGQSALKKMWGALMELGSAFRDLGESFKPVFGVITDELTGFIRLTAEWVKYLAEAAKWMGKIGSGAPESKTQKWLEQGAKYALGAAMGMLAGGPVGAALGVGIAGQHDDAKKDKPRQDVEYPTGGLSSLSDVYDRLSLASVKGTSGFGKKPEEGTEEHTKSLAEGFAAFWAWIQGQQLPATR
jgi:hypothetical protein